MVVYCLTSQFAELISLISEEVKKHEIFVVLVPDKKGVKNDFMIACDVK